MNIKMATNSQLSTTESKKQNPLRKTQSKKNQGNLDASNGFKDSQGPQGKNGYQ